MALLGVASAIIGVVDLLTRDSVSAALGTRGYTLVSFYVMAAVVPVAAVRRDGRIRELAFQSALLAAMLLGFVALFTGVAAFMRGVDANFVLSWVMFVLALALASSLSRASAKAWFSSPAQRR
jgi:hypothetical protein